MPEYIERERLYNELCRLEDLARGRVTDTPTNSPAFARYNAQLSERTTLKHLVLDAPAADVEPVVRCKDCKHIRPEVDAYTGEAVGCWCGLLDLGSIEENHFCSYGERKEG